MALIGIGDLVAPCGCDQRLAFTRNSFCLLQEMLDFSQLDLNGQWACGLMLLLGSLDLFCLVQGSLVDQNPPSPGWPMLSGA